MDEVTTPDETATELEQVASAAVVLALGNVASRAVGLAREVVKSYLFGAGGVVDAYNVAARVPLLLYDLLVAGMVHSALVPVFVAHGEGRRADLWRLFSALVSLTTLVMALLVIVIERFAPQIAWLFSGGSSPEVLALTADLLRVAGPALLFLSVSDVVSGLLYALRRFAYPALTGAVFNAAIVLVAVLLHAQLGVAAMALGLLAGAALRVVVQVPGLRGTGMRFRPALNHPGLRRVAALYAPIVLGLLVEVLISRPVTYNLASRTGAGGISWMDYATTLWQFPQGMVATAISFAVLPTLAAHAAAARTTGEGGPFRAALAHGLRLSVALIVPVTVGVFILARPVVMLLFEHGSFTPYDTAMTCMVLRLYLIGLPFHAVDLLLVFAFYARHDTLTPALIGVGAAAVYVVLAAGLLPVVGLFGIMVADAVKIILHTAVSLWLLRRRVGGGFEGVPRTLARAGLAAAVMGAAVYVVWQAGALLFGGATGLLPELLTVALPVLVGGGVYLALLHRLGVAEVTRLWQSVRQRI